MRKAYLGMPSGALGSDEFIWKTNQTNTFLCCVNVPLLCACVFVYLFQVAKEWVTNGFGTTERGTKCQWGTQILPCLPGNKVKLKLNPGHVRPEGGIADHPPAWECQTSKWTCMGLQIQRRLGLCKRVRTVWYRWLSHPTFTPPDRSNWHIRPVCQSSNYNRPVCGISDQCWNNAQTYLIFGKHTKLDRSKEAQSGLMKVDRSI